MAIFSISDLHLSGLSDKPMYVFGAGWENHFEKIKSDWKKKVLSDEDIVLIAGDISWGTTLEEGLYDLNFLKDLPGKKVFIRGNHDFWWNGITKLRRAAPDEKFYFLQNDCVKFGDVIICGSRGGPAPEAATTRTLTNGCTSGKPSGSSSVLRRLKRSGKRATSLSL